MNSLVILILLFFSFGSMAAEKSPEATKKLFQVLGLEQSMQQSLLSSVDLTLAQADNAKTIRSDLIKFMNETIGYKAIEKDLIEVYQKNFTEAEQLQLIEFYQSPAGKKLVNLQPKLYQEAAEIGHRKMLEHQEELQKILATPKSSSKKKK